MRRVVLTKTTLSFAFPGEVTLTDKLIQMYNTFANQLVHSDIDSVRYGTSLQLTHADQHDIYFFHPDAFCRTMRSIACRSRTWSRSASMAETQPLIGCVVAIKSQECNNNGRQSYLRSRAHEYIMLRTRLKLIKILQ